MLFFLCLVSHSFVVKAEGEHTEGDRTKGAGTERAQTKEENVEDGDSSSETDRRAQAREVFKRGKELFKQKDYDGAIAAFKETYKIWQHRVVLYNLAVTYAFKGDHVNAARNARAFLKKAKEKEKKLPRILKESMRKVGVLVISVPDPNVGLFVDGREVGRGTAEAVVPAGVRVIEVRDKDRVLKRAEVMVEGGKEKVWELAEIPKPPEPKPRPVVRPRPRPRPVVTPPPKKKEPEKKIGTLHWGGFLGVTTLAAGSLAGAIALSLKTRDIHQEFEKDKTDAELADQGKRYQLGANILWGVSAAAAVGTVIIAVFTDWKGASKKESPKVSYQISPGGASFKLSW